MPDASIQATAPAVRANRIGLLPGTEPLGEFAGSGYREPPHLVSRADGQVVSLPELLYALVTCLEDLDAAGAPDLPPARRLAGIAEAVNRQTGHSLTGDHIAYLLDQKLAPLGITTYSDGSLPRLAKATGPLSLQVKKAVLSERATWFLSGLFLWLFRWPVALVLLAAAAVSQVWVFATQPVGLAFVETFSAPVGVLLVAAFAIVSTAFHEFGHASACRASGVRPGVIGYGLYVVWPVFYTDVTASYRVGRAARLRIDLAGVYFNALFVVLLAGLYAGTGYKPLLVAILVTNLEIVQQLLPTLRFDGYYIVADLVGIPDLFKYIGPILKRTFLRRPADPALAVLKSWPQRVVTVWVIVVIPALVAVVGFVVLQLPELAAANWEVIRQTAADPDASLSYLASVASTMVVTLALILPIAGIIVILAQALRAIRRIVLRGRDLRRGTDLPARTRARVRQRTVFAAAGVVIVGAGALAAIYASLSSDGSSAERSPATQSAADASPAAPPVASQRARDTRAAAGSAQRRAAAARRDRAAGARTARARASRPRAPQAAPRAGARRAARSARPPAPRREAPSRDASAAEDRSAAASRAQFEPGYFDPGRVDGGAAATAASRAAFRRQFEPGYFPPWPSPGSVVGAVE